MRRWLVVGLGNPGERYLRTRHNLGFRVVDRAAERWRVGFVRRGTALESCWLEPPGCGDAMVKLLKPLTYMNRSGIAVREAVAKEGLEAQEVLVVCDDVSLPFGKLRLRLKGSDGGHNGLASVIAELGTQAFPRLRIGIGNQFPQGGLIDYVLSPFNPEEEERLPEVVERAVDAITSFACEGAEKAMARFNR